jgi:hypothetical protein
MASYHENLRDNVKPEKLSEFDNGQILEDENSLVEQSGLFKIESIHKEAYFRNMKSYWLGTGNPKNPIIRARSIPR